MPVVAPSLTGNILRQNRETQNQENKESDTSTNTTPHRNTTTSFHLIQQPASSTFHNPSVSSNTTHLSHGSHARITVTAHQYAHLKQASSIYKKLTLNQESLNAAGYRYSNNDRNSSQCKKEDIGKDPRDIQDKEALDKKRSTNGSVRNKGYENSYSRISSGVNTPISNRKSENNVLSEFEIEEDFEELGYKELFRRACPSCPKKCCVIQ